MTTVRTILTPPTPLIDTIKTADPAADVKDALDKAYKERPDINQEDQNGMTPLCHAVEKVNSSAVEWLLDKKNHPVQSSPDNHPKHHVFVKAFSYEDSAAESKDPVILRKRKIIDMLIMRYHCTKEGIAAMVASNNWYVIHVFTDNLYKNLHAGDADASDYPVKTLAILLQEAIKQDKPAIIDFIMQTDRWDNIKMQNRNNRQLSSVWRAKLREQHKTLVMDSIKREQIQLASRLVSFGFPTGDALMMTLKQKSSAASPELDNLIIQLSEGSTLEHLRVAVNIGDVTIIKPLLATVVFTNWQEIIDIGLKPSKVMVECLLESKQNIARVDNKDKTILTHVLMDAKSSAQVKKDLAIKLLQQGTPLMTQDLQYVWSSKDPAIQALAPDLIQHYKSRELRDWSWRAELPPLVEINLWGFAKLVQWLFVDRYVREPFAATYQNQYPLFHALHFYKQNKTPAQRKELMDVINLIHINRNGYSDRPVQLHEEELHLAIELGDLELVQHLVTQFPNGLKLVQKQAGPMRKAIDAGHIHILQWLLGLGHPDFSSAKLMETAIDREDIATMKMLMPHYYRLANLTDYGFGFYSETRNAIGGLLYLVEQNWAKHKNSAKYNRIHDYIKALDRLKENYDTRGLDLSQHCHKMEEEDAVDLLLLMLNIARKTHNTEWIKKLFTDNVQKIVAEKLSTPTAEAKPVQKPQEAPKGTASPSAPPLAPSPNAQEPTLAPVHVVASAPPGGPEMQVEGKPAPPAENKAAPIAEPQPESIKQSIVAAPAAEHQIEGVRSSSPVHANGISPPQAEEPEEDDDDDDNEKKSIPASKQPLDAKQTPPLPQNTSELLPGQLTTVVRYSMFNHGEILQIAQAAKFFKKANPRAWKNLMNVDDDFWTPELAGQMRERCAKLIETSMRKSGS